MSMQLAPPAKGYHEQTLLDFPITKFNGHAKTQEFAVTRKGSK